MTPKDDSCCDLSNEVNCTSLSIILALVAKSLSLSVASIHLQAIRQLEILSPQLRTRTDMHEPPRTSKVAAEKTHHHHKIISLRILLCFVDEFHTCISLDHSYDEIDSCPDY